LVASILCYVFFGHLEPIRYGVNKIKNGLGESIPEAAGSWPIIGHLHLLAGPQVPHKVLGSMADKLGPIFTIKFGVHRVLVVSNSEMAKEVFASRPKAMATELMAYNYANFGLAPYGPYWRHMRKIITLELASHNRLQMLAQIRSTEVKSSIIEMYRTWERNKGSSETIMKMKKTAKEMDVVLNGWLEEQKKKMNATSAVQVDENGDHAVFMAALLSLVKEQIKEEMYGFSTDEIVKATCLAIFAASTDTTMATLTWALALLVNNPLVLEKAQHELQNYVGRDRKVEESDMNNLVYLQAIIKETMRLYPAGPLSAPHESTEDCIVGGYTIPKGTRLLVNIWKIHHDPQIWTDPFDPGLINHKASTLELLVAPRLLPHVYGALA
ncbi:hypothetical protein M8C21_018397, partial [Ambrosia artemisiifolia]